MDLGNCRLLRELTRSHVTAVHAARVGELEVRCERFDPLPGLDPAALQTLRADFVRQAGLLAGARHPNLVRVVALDLTDARPWCATERLDGARRMDELLAAGPMAPDALATLVESAARGMEHAHGLGLLHGLLTPERVLVDEGLRPVLTGFGRGARTQAVHRAGDRLAWLELLMSAAPELLGGQAPDRLSDVYGLGLLLYEGLCGRPPHQSNVPMSAQQRLLVPPPAPSRFRSDVDPTLEAIAMRCLELTPAARYPSALAVAEALAARRGTAGGQIGRYRLLEELGRGGMGQVWRAVDPAGREVALKLMAPEANPLRFAREVAILADLAHPHVVRLLDTGTHHGRPFMVMELIEGMTLEALARQGPLPPRLVAHILAQVARALDHAHQRGVVHRDVKPSNVLVQRDGRAVLLDFGLAKALRPERLGPPLTKRYSVVGTPFFAAPEQFRDSTAVGPAADLFALGLSLWAALTGEAPFARGTLGETCQAVLHAPLPSLRAVRPDAGAALEAICARCLDRDPQQRFRSAGELAERLEQVARAPATAPAPPR